MAKNLEMMPGEFMMVLINVHKTNVIAHKIATIATVTIKLVSMRLSCHSTITFPGRSANHANAKPSARITSS